MTGLNPENAAVFYITRIHPIFSPFGRQFWRPVLLPAKQCGSKAILLTVLVISILLSVSISAPAAAANPEPPPPHMDSGPVLKGDGDAGHGKQPESLREELQPDLSSVLGAFRDIYWTETFSRDPVAAAQKMPLPVPWNRLLERFHIEGFLLNRHVILSEGEVYQAEDRQRQIHYGWMTSYSSLVGIALERDDLAAVERIRRQMVDTLRSLDFPGRNRKLGLVNSNFTKLFLQARDYPRAAVAARDLYRWNDLEPSLQRDLLCILFTAGAWADTPLQQRFPGVAAGIEVRPSFWFRSLFRMTDPASRVPAYHEDEERLQIYYFTLQAYSQLLNLAAASGSIDSVIACGAHLERAFEFITGDSGQTWAVASRELLLDGLSRLVEVPLPDDIDYDVDVDFDLGSPLLKKKDRQYHEFVSLLEFPGGFLTAALVDGAAPDPKRRIFSGLANSTAELAVILIERGDDAGARNAFDALADLMGTAHIDRRKDKVDQIYDELIRIYVLRGDYTEARGLLDEFIARARGKRKMYLTFLSAECEVSAGDLGRAWELYWKVTEDLDG